MSVRMSESIARLGESAGVRAIPSFETMASEPTVETYPTTFPLSALSMFAENWLSEMQPERSQAVSSASFTSGILQANTRDSMSTRRVTSIRDFMTPPISNHDLARRWARASRSVHYACPFDPLLDGSNHYMKEEG